MSKLNLAMQKSGRLTENFGHFKQAGIDFDIKKMLCLQVVPISH